MNAGAPDPSAEDLEVAYECLRKVPFDVSPVQHLGRIIARYRERLQAHNNAIVMPPMADLSEHVAEVEGG